VDDDIKEQISRICREILVPLVRTDGGEMYLVRYDGDDVHIHLAGACAGCPGASMTSDKVILPALRTASPKLAEPQTPRPPRALDVSADASWRRRRPIRSGRAARSDR
jgi:Fe-S cluster biogenesis protein NfuA